MTQASKVLKVYRGRLEILVLKVRRESKAYKVRKVQLVQQVLRVILVRKVYVGSTAPTDSKYEIWINPDGPSTPFSQIASLIYPVGSIYMSVNNTDPSILFGGTWERIKDRFLLSAGDSYIGGSTGGEAAVKLESSNLPAITVSGIPYPMNHTGYPNGSADSGNGTSSTGNYQQCYWRGYGTKSITTQYHNTAHNNMPPYLTVYMWRRTA